MNIYLYVNFWRKKKLHGRMEGMRYKLSPGGKSTAFSRFTVRCSYCQISKSQLLKSKESTRSYKCHQKHSLHLPQLKKLRVLSYLLLHSSSIHPFPARSPTFPLPYLYTPITIHTYTHPRRTIWAYLTNDRLEVITLDL